MPAKEHPGFDFDYDIDLELQRIRAHQLHRGIPERRHDNMLLASWNLCNLGDAAQPRSVNDMLVMAEMLRPFDLIAVQEIKDDYNQFRGLVRLLGREYDYMITDKAGNDERLGFIFNTSRVSRMQLAGELVQTPFERSSPKVKINNIKYKMVFTGFNRNPYIAAFRAGQFVFTLANVHILFGSGLLGYRRRIGEIYALAKWADDRVTEKYDKTFDHDIILVGDFNIPKLKKSDPVGKQLIKYGMQSTHYGSFVGTNLSGRDQYDQIAFHPEYTRDKFTGNSGVFDFDKVIFREVWETYMQESFSDFVAYHISDHRLIWSEWRNTND
ncbi:MAG: endonuclease/exonuclease/phosphatase family protein [Planctomycetota bacterium]|jgi:endonuclease/exonuclease/phosphatase family metal-dependent hydrolase